MAQKVEQEFQFINLPELINKQLTRAVQDIQSRFSFVENAANSHETQAARLVQENLRLRKRLAAAGLADNGELFTIEAPPTQNEVLKFSPPPGDSDHVPPPPKYVEARGSSNDTGSEVRVRTPKTDKIAWHDADSGTSEGAKEQSNRRGRRKSCEECAGIWGAHFCRFCGLEKRSTIELQQAPADGNAKDAGKRDSPDNCDAVEEKPSFKPNNGKMHDGHFTPVMPLQDADSSSTRGAMVATDLDLEDVQDVSTTVMPLSPDAPETVEVGAQQFHPTTSTQALEAQYSNQAPEAQQEVAIVPMYNPPRAGRLSLEAQDTMVTRFSLENDFQQYHTMLSMKSMESQYSMRESGFDYAPQGSIESQSAMAWSAESLASRRMTGQMALANGEQGGRNPYDGVSIFCSDCGDRFADDAMFCCKCGRRRHQSQDIVKGTRASEIAAPGSARSKKGKKGLANHVVAFKESRATLSTLPEEKQRVFSSEYSTQSAAGGNSMTLNRGMSATSNAAFDPKLTVRDSPSTNPGMLMGGMKSMSTTKFATLPVWSAMKPPAKKMMKSYKKTMAKSKWSVDRPEEEEEQVQMTFKERLTRNCYIMNPNDSRRGVWDTTSLLLVIYDIGAIPFEFFDPPETAVSFLMTWFTRCFWTLDIWMSFFTGYVTHDGFIEMRPGKIASRYAKSWLTLDILIVLVDWMELVMAANSSLGFARMGKASRTFRIIRMLRLLRLARMREVLGLITERINSEKVVIIADILKTMAIILGLAHLIACVWWAVGSASEDEAVSWIRAAKKERAPVADRYFISLHWSIAQFAGGMDEVTPQNPNERIYAISMFILAFIVASVFVSAITSSMTQLNIIGSHQSQQVSTLRRYLHQNGISRKLAVRVQRNAQHALIEQLKILPESAVVLLTFVSEPLRVEIHLEMYAPVLNVHHFFAKYIEECPQVMRKVCHLATTIIMVSAGDVIFSAGEMPTNPKMYIICNGTLEYECGQEGTTVNIGDNQWVSEAALWVEWMHRGSLMAATDARLCVLDAHKFQHICSQFSHSDFNPGNYARDFVRELNNSPKPSDLPFDYEERHSKRDSGDWMTRRRGYSWDGGDQSKCAKLKRCLLCQQDTKTRKLDAKTTKILYDPRLSEAVLTTSTFTSTSTLKV